MRAILGLLLVVVLGLIAAFALGLIGVDKTRDAKLPEIKAEGGQMPGFDVKTADVAVGTTNTTVEVPKIETEKKSVAIPTLDVKKAH